MCCVGCRVLCVLWYVVCVCVVFCVVFLLPVVCCLLRALRGLRVFRLFRELRVLRAGLDAVLSVVAVCCVLFFFSKKICHTGAGSRQAKQTEAPQLGVAVQKRTVLRVLTSSKKRHHCLTPFALFMTRRVKR